MSRNYDSDEESDAIRIAQLSSASSISTFRYSNLGRERLLEEFSTRFQKTKNLLHERNEQCSFLASEIHKYKNELVDLHELIQNLEKLNNEMRDLCTFQKEALLKEQARKKLLLEEVAKLRQEKQERLKEREIMEQENLKAEMQLKKVLDEHAALEVTAKKISKQLQDANQDRLKHRKSFFENQDLTQKYSKKLDALRDELQDMKSLVYTSIDVIRDN